MVFRPRARQRNGSSHVSTPFVRYLLFTAEEFGLEAGGLLLNSTKEHKPHGRASAESTSVAPAGARAISPRRYSCQALLKGLGLPGIVPLPPDFANCVQLPKSEAGLREGLRWAAARSLGDAACVYSAVTSSRVWIHNSTTLAPRAAVRARYAAAQNSSFALPPSAIAPSDRVVVAMHVRRGDVSLTRGRANSPYTDNAWYERMARALPTYFRGLRLEFHVYSEGRPGDFGRLPELATMHLDGDPLQAIADMVSADVLVTAKSSFSYVPAFMSAGVVLYQNFLHGVPAPHWRDADAVLALAEREARISRC